MSRTTCCRCRTPRTTRRKAARGKAKFETICAACHGPDGKGNQALGAPNLTDKIWLYGGTVPTVVQTITNGRGSTSLAPGQSAMPAWKATLTPAQIHLVAAYVWSLSNSAGYAGGDTGGRSGEIRGIMIDAALR